MLSSRPTPSVGMVYALKTLARDYYFIEFSCSTSNGRSFRRPGWRKFDNYIRNEKFMGKVTIKHQQERDLLNCHCRCPSGWPWVANKSHFQQRKLQSPRQLVGVLFVQGFPSVTRKCIAYERIAASLSRGP